MHVLVNGVRLLVDVANCSLVPDRDGLREKPTLLMLHGGPVKALREMIGCLRDDAIPARISAALA